jgi:hypothetical protein
MRKYAINEFLRDPAGYSGAAGGNLWGSSADLPEFGTHPASSSPTIGVALGRIGPILPAGRQIPP